MVLENNNYSIEYFRDLSAKGEYLPIAEHAPANFNEIELLWILIDAYIILGEFYKAESLLEIWKDKLKINKDISLWYLKKGVWNLEQSRIEEAFRLFEIGLSYITSVSDPDLHTFFQIYRARCIFKQGKLIEAIDLLNIEIETLIERDNKYYLAIAFHNLGNAYHDQGDAEKSLYYYLQGLKIRETLGNNYDIAISLANVGYSYFEQGKFELAIKPLQDSLKKFEKSGSVKYIALLRINLATVYREQARYDLALQLTEQALDLFKQKYPDLQYIGWSYNNLGIIYRELGRFSTALEAFEESILYYQKLGNPQYISRALVDIAITKSSEGTLNIDSTALLSRFPSIEIKSPILEGYKNIILALIAQKRKNFGSAEELWEKNLRITGLPFNYQVLCHESLTEIALIEWMIEPSSFTKDKLDQRLNDFEKLCQQLNLFVSLYKAYLFRAKLASFQFQFAEAEEWLEKCLDASIHLPLHHNLAEKELEDLQKRRKASLKNHDQQTDKNQDYQQIRKYLKEISILINQNNY